MRELNGLFYVYRHRFARFPPLGKKVDGKYFTVSLTIPIRILFKLRTDTCQLPRYDTNPEYLPSIFSSILRDQEVNDEGVGGGGRVSRVKEKVVLRITMTRDLCQVITTVTGEKKQIWSQFDRTNHKDKCCSGCSSPNRKIMIEDVLLIQRDWTHI